MTRRKTIMFLTAVEDAVNKAVVRSQAYRLLTHFDQSSDFRIIFFSMIPFRFYFRLDNPIRSFLQISQKRRELRAEFRTANVDILFCPFLFPFRSKYFHMKLFHLCIFLLQAVPILFSLALIKRISFIHARSYPACLIANICGGLLDIPYLFDMRGFFPDEGVLYGAYAEDSSDYLRWKRVEKRLVEQAFSIFVESEPFKDYVEEINRHPNIALFPCYVDNNIYTFDEGRRNRLREQFGLDGKFVVTYCGTIGGWHDPALQADYYLRIKTRIRNTHFLILTLVQNNHRIEQTMRAKGIGQEEYTLLNPPTTDVPKYLLLGDLGLLIIANLPLARKFVSVKLGEYLACGLPVACTPFVEGAATLIEDHNCGVVLDIDTPMTFERLDLLLSQHEEVRLNGLRLVADQLSVKKAARRFLEIYEAGMSHEHKGS